MRVDFGLPPPPPSGAPPVILTIGNFDGVHRGHRFILDRVVSEARAHGGEAVVLTFDPHPRCVLDPDNCPPQLTTLDEKRDLLTAAGVDRLIVLEFTRAVSAWPAEEFCARLLQALPLRRLIVGHDFALGHRRRGDITFLREWGAMCDIEVEAVEPVLVDAEVASSSQVRAALVDGDVARANRLLGRPYFLDSWVDHGLKRGTRIGFPTANLSVTPNKCLPARGIYAMWVRVAQRWCMAATSVGYNVTFGGDRLTVEAHLLDFDDDIYRQRVRAAFVARIREERAYPSVEELVAQITDDVATARRLLEENAPPDSL